MDSIKTQLLKVETLKDNSILSLNSLVLNINKVLDVLHSKDLNVPGSLFANYRVSNDKIMFTPEGGLAVRLINKTSSASVKGYCVDVGSIANSVRLVPVGDPDCIGVFYESGILDGEYAWIVCSGLADVYYSGSTILGYVARTPLTGDAVGIKVAGNATCIAVPSSSPAVAEHFYEIGHVLEARTGAGLARTLLHFN